VSWRLLFNLDWASEHDSVLKIGFEFLLHRVAVLNYMRTEMNSVNSDLNMTNWNWSSNVTGVLPTVYKWLSVCESFIVAEPEL